ncbi:hypothetical protein VTK73DRAFT_1882 [Phialemonium thermophilum]|uniref:Uncharacterized protein n=1 Tax=Phialemonium thermophilum TaxID=223376 RepID=A0ABR3VSX2_9PEZI
MMRVFSGFRDGILWLACQGVWSCMSLSVVFRRRNLIKALAKALIHGLVVFITLAKVPGKTYMEKNSWVLLPSRVALRVHPVLLTRLSFGFCFSQALQSREACHKSTLLSAYDSFHSVQNDFLSLVRASDFGGWVSELLQGFQASLKDDGKVERPSGTDDTPCDRPLHYQPLQHSEIGTKGNDHARETVPQDATSNLYSKFPLHFVPNAL